MRTSAFWSSPVLASTLPVIEASRFVRTDEEEIRRVAGWMAYEPFGMPNGMVQFDVGDDPDRLTDVIMLIASLNFAFTDFATGERFEVDYLGERRHDADAMFACLHRALMAGEPVIDGAWMAAVTRADLERIFDGSITMPMLDERVAVLNEVGRTLVERFDGRFHVWAASCQPALYADGEGMLERLVADFPRFDDASDYHGHRVRLHKLAQLGLWMLHAVNVRAGRPGLRDLHLMTAFADYIVPLALRLMRILDYDESLATRIRDGVEIPRDSDEEIEIRAHSLYATALLTDAMNELRPADMQLVIPQLDYRLWSTYHIHLVPHHLTRTIMY